MYYVMENHVRECDIPLASVIRKVEKRPGSEHYVMLAHTGQTGNL